MPSEPSKDATREPQYYRLLEMRDRKGLAQMGLMSSFTWHDDPKRLLFVMARYKFVAKMFEGMDHALEIGCADAFGTRIVRQAVRRLTATDFDPLLVKDVVDRMDDRWSFDCRVHDMLTGPVDGEFGGAYSLDVLEHIPAESEALFIRNIAASLPPHGTLIIGTPSLESQVYASPGSKEGHINCKSHAQLRALMSRFFHNVFMFSMNDEVIHTGFGPMAHYLFAVGCSKRMEAFE